MATVLEILQGAETSENDALQQAKSFLDVGKPSDAKKAITAGQAKIRQAKAELVAQEREVRDQFKQARLNMNKQGQTIGMFMGSKARGNKSRVRAAGKRDLAQKEHDALAPYTSAKAALDKAVAELGSVKLQIDAEAAEAKAGASITTAATPVEAAPATPVEAAPPTPAAAAPPPPPPPLTRPPPPTAPQWSPDPHGRHELRWWDGTTWTEHVANAGQVTTDPLD
jgi:Protein of unknown function (DUF2510)